jgi:hypothetical protein
MNTDTPVDQTSPTKSDATTLGSIRAAVECCLCILEYKYSVEREGAEMRFRCGTKSGAIWHAQILVYEREQVARLIIHCGMATAANRLTWSKELVRIFNNRVAILGFMAIDDDGATSYRSTADLRGDSSILGGIKRLLNAAAFPLGIWEHSFRHLTDRKASPTDAINAALISDDAYELSDVSKGTRRALISVLK